MVVAITIRNIPDETRDELAARAARAGQSLQEYLRAHLIEEASHPTQAEIIARARERVRATGSTLTAESILAARDDARR
jgi:plasmid stability protein